MTTPRKQFVALVALALSVGHVSSARAAGDKWALLIGVDKCKAVGELKVCSADALAMKSVLVQIGYPSRHITMLTDSQPDFTAFPTLSNVERAIVGLAEVAEANDTVLLFFSGHGVTANGTSYLVPTDGDLKKGVSLTWIKDQLAACKAKEKVVILDACHSGAAKGVSGIAPDLKTSGNLMMLLSCEKDQVSWPNAEGQHSVFTAAVLEGLSGKAANADRKVTQHSLADYVLKRVKDWTYENRKNKQTPILVAAASGDMVLADLTGILPLNGGKDKNPPAIEQVVIPDGPPEGKPWVSPASDMKFVWVPALKIWVGKFEVTNGEYRKMVFGHSSNEFMGRSLNGERQPVVNVNFDDAKAYAMWLTQRDRSRLGGMRYRLISEQEWQTCAQCGDGREYPWGSSLPPRFGNYSDSVSAVGGRVGGYTDGYVVTCPVELSGANEWGLYGLGGNVWEFCASDATGASMGASRGASWNCSDLSYIRCEYRNVTGGSNRNNISGFRLALSR